MPDSKKLEAPSHLFGADTGVCVKDTKGLVTHQNEACQQTCGDQAGHICTKHCMSNYHIPSDLPALLEGATVIKDMKIESTAGHAPQNYDVVILNNGDQIVTLLYPLKAKYEKETKFLNQLGLSPREREILGLVFEGRTRAQIAEQLHISLPTLKTHLNNIYKKLPMDVKSELQRRHQA